MTCAGQGVALGLARTFRSLPTASDGKRTREYEYPWHPWHPCARYNLCVGGRVMRLREYMKRGQPHKALERRCLWRRVPNIPWLKPWRAEK
jgi:hypothetical protein